MERGKKHEEPECQVVEHAPHAPQLDPRFLLAESVLLEIRCEPLLHRGEDLVPECRRPMST